MSDTLSYIAQHLTTSGQQIRMMPAASGIIYILLTADLQQINFSQYRRKTSTNSNP